MAVVKREFGKNSKSEQAYFYEITNEAGMKAVVTDFGATLHSLYVPDKDGKLRDVVWGYDSVAEYEFDNGPYFGATIGRIANRVGASKFTLNGVEYQMEVNERTNCLHSGPNCYHVRMWDAVMMKYGVRFSIVSPDGDQGLPGEFVIRVTYTLTEDNALKITYEGYSDQDTYVSMTNHSYFNLDGEEAESVLDHELMINADSYTRVNDELITTGEILKVEGTAMDFRTAKKIGRDIYMEEEPLRIGGGYDHNFVLCVREADVPAARLSSKVSGIGMEVYTDCPGIQVYSGNFLGDKAGKGGRIYPKRSAVAMETQYYPNAVNHPHFPSPLLKAQEKYLSETEYRFFVI